MSSKSKKKNKKRKIKVKDETICIPIGIAIEFIDTTNEPKCNVNFAQEQATIICKCIRKCAKKDWSRISIVSSGGLYDFDSYLENEIGWRTANNGLKHLVEADHLPVPYFLKRELPCPSGNPIHADLSFRVLSSALVALESAFDDIIPVTGVSDAIYQPKDKNPISLAVFSEITDMFKKLTGIKNVRIIGIFPEEDLPEIASNWQEESDENMMSKEIGSREVIMSLTDEEDGGYPDEDYEDYGDEDSDEENKDNIEDLLVGSINDKTFIFAEYLRERQRKAGYLPKEAIVAMSDEELLDSYRICSHCGEPFYSKENETHVIMECSTPEQAFNMLGELTDEANKSHFEHEKTTQAMLKEVKELKTTTEPLSQEYVFSLFGPIILNRGLNYSKFGNILIREAKTEETIETHTPDGKLETTNKAVPSDFIIRNPTGEEYVFVPKEKFLTRYSPTDRKETINSKEYGVFVPKGKCRGVLFTKKLAEELKLTLDNNEFFFMAIWKEPMRAAIGDMLVSPLDDAGNLGEEVYRIEKTSFEKTYRLNEK